MNKYQLGFYIFIILTALMVNYYSEMTPEIIFFFSGNNIDISKLKKLLKKTNYKITVIPSNPNQSTLTKLKELNNIRPINEIGNIENFRNVLVENCYRMKPKYIYCSENNVFYNIVNKINVYGYDFNFETLDDKCIGEEY